MSGEDTITDVSDWFHELCHTLDGGGGGLMPLAT